MKTRTAKVLMVVSLLSILPTQTEAKFRLPNPFKNGAFGWLWQPEIRVDGETRAVAERAINEVHLLNERFEQFPLEMQKAMLPVIQEASDQLQLVFTQSIDHFSEEMEQLVDHTFRQLNVTIDHAFDRAEKLIGDALHDVEDISDRTTTRLDQIAGVRLSQLDGISKTRLDELMTGLDGIVQVFSGKVSNELLIFNKHMNSLVDKVTLNTRLVFSEADLAVSFQIQHASQEMQVVVKELEKAGYAVVAHASREARDILGELDEITKQRIQELGILTDNALTRLEELEVKTRDDASGLIDRFDNSVSSAFKQISILACFLVALLLAYQVAIRALSGGSFNMGAVQLSMLAGVVLLCFGLMVWQVPFDGMFGYEAPGPEPAATELEEDVPDYQYPEPLQTSFPH